MPVVLEGLSRGLRLYTHNSDAIIDSFATGGKPIAIYRAQFRSPLHRDSPKTKQILNYTCHIRDSNPESYIQQPQDQ